MAEPQTWTATECAAHAGISEASWRAYVSRRHPRADPAPRPLEGFDEQRRRRWDAGEVRAWQARRAGAGARTDLPSVGRRVAEMAGLLLDLADEIDSDRVPRERIRAEWAALRPEHDVPMGRSRGSASRRQVLNLITQLERRGWVRREGQTAVVVCDRDALTEAAGHVSGTA